VRAATAAARLCGGPPLHSFASAARRFYGAEAISDVLNQRDKLKDWLDCGRAAAAVTEFSFYEAVLKSPVGELDRVVRLIPDKSSFEPAFFRPAVSSPTGLSGIRCALLVGDRCLQRSRASGRIDRMRLFASGDLASLEHLAAPPAATGGSGSAALVAAFSADDLAGRDVTVSTRDDRFLGHIEAAAGSDEASRLAQQKLASTSCTSASATIWSLAWWRHPASAGSRTSA
jgi:hypothetical protein